MNSRDEQSIIEKLRRLPPEMQAEVEDFVDFLNSRDEERALARAAGHLSGEALRKVWNNEDDADYDRL